MKCDRKETNGGEMMILAEEVENARIDASETATIRPTNAQAPNGH
jgi:hypothetical protein